MRLNSIDVLRALAIIFMVQVHFVGNLAHRTPSQALIYEASFVPGNLAAPLFTFLVGVSLWLSLHRRRMDGQPERQIAGRTLRRALVIFVVGLIFNLAIWGPVDLFDWDILTLIGTVLALVYVAGFLPGWAIVTLCLVILAASPPLRDLTDYGSHWLTEAGAYTEYITRWRVEDILLGWALRGYFPVLPWLIFPLAGYASARHLLGTEGGIRRRRAWGLTAGGVMLGLLGLGAAWLWMDLDDPLAWYLSRLTFYPAGTSYVLLVLGIGMAGFAGLWLALDSDEARRVNISRQRWMTFLGRYSRYSLSVYVIHHAVHLWPMYAAGLVAGDVWTYWQDWVSPAGALALAGAFLVTFYLALVGWDRVRGRGSLEWLLARVIG
jgi:uncharacterized membrane protein